MPGSQKLTPPSSAAAIVGILMRALRVRMNCLNLERDMPCPPRDFDNPTWLHGVRTASDHTLHECARIFAGCGELVTLARLWTWGSLTAELLLFIKLS